MVTLLSKSNTNVDYKRFKTSKDVMAKNGARSNYEKKLCEKIATFDSCFFRLKKKPINPSQCKTTWLNRKVR